MAPLVAAQRRAAVDATVVRRERSRSRSPAAGASGRKQRASRGQRPQLKDWVLVRNGSRFWRDAVPALISKVTTGLSEEDFTFCLVLPNRLALQHGFGSSRPFLELSGVSIRDVRPYAGSDETQLRATLLTAIKEFRTGKAAGSTRPLLPPTTAAPEPAQLMQEEVGVAPTAPQQHVQEGPQPSCDSELAAAPSEAAEDDDSADSEGSEAEAAAPSPAAPMPETAPTTPLPRSEEARRPLTRVESLPKEAPAAPAPEPAAAEIVCAGKTAPKAAPEPVPAKRYAELTAAVARAFRSHGAMELSRQEVEAAVGLAFGREELAQGLQRLDQENKVFLSGDLVFLI